MFSFRRLPVLPNTDITGYSNSISFLDTAVERYGGKASFIDAWLDQITNGTTCHTVFSPIPCVPNLQSYLYPRADCVTAIWFPHDIVPKIKYKDIPINFKPHVAHINDTLSECRSIDPVCCDDTVSDKSRTIDPDPTLDTTKYHRIVPIHPAIFRPLFIPHFGIEVDVSCTAFIEYLAIDRMIIQPTEQDAKYLSFESVNISIVCTFDSYWILKILESTDDGSISDQEISCTSRDQSSGV